MSRTDNLTPATGARTTRFCRPQQPCSSFMAFASTASHRNVRDDRDPSPQMGETRGLKPLICPTAKAEYFSAEGWTVAREDRGRDLPVGHVRQNAIAAGWVEPTD